MSYVSYAPYKYLLEQRKKTWRRESVQNNYIEIAGHTGHKMQKHRTASNFFRVYTRRTQNLQKRVALTQCQKVNLKINCKEGGINKRQPTNIFRPWPDKPRSWETAKERGAGSSSGKTGIGRRRGLDSKWRKKPRTGKDRQTARFNPLHDIGRRRRGWNIGRRTVCKNSGVFAENQSPVFKARDWRAVKTSESAYQTGNRGFGGKVNLKINCKN